MTANYYSQYSIETLVFSTIVVSESMYSGKCVSMKPSTYVQGFQYLMDVIDTHTDTHYAASIAIRML